MTAGLEVRLLGPVMVLVDGEPLDVGPAKQRCVLAVLLHAVGTRVPTETLIDRVWGDAPPAEVRSVLYSHITRLRKVLRQHGVDVRRQAGGYVIDLPEEPVDLHHSTALVRRAAAVSGVDRLALLEQALELWRGEPLDEVPGEWAGKVRAGLRRQLLDLLTDWAEQAIAVGRPEAVVARLGPAVDRYPHAEALVAALVVALARAGRTAHAWQRYHDVVARLRDQLGTEPGPALRAAYRELSGQPSISDPRPELLPAAPAGFVGRERQLARLTSLVDGEPPQALLLVTGTAGVGKTALAVTWGHQVADRFPDGRLYVDLRGYAAARPLPPLEALTMFLRALGVAARDIPPDEAGAAGLYRSLLAGRRVLVVLDNAATAAQVRPLLPGAPGSATVITARERLPALLVAEGAHRLRLDTVDQSEAVALLAASIGGHRVAVEPVACGELVELCARLPLALRIAGAFLLDDPDRAIADYVAELRADDPLTALEITGYSVRGALDLSYARLSQHERRLFRLLPQHPGRDVTAPAAAELAGTDVATAGRLLDRLADAHLVEPCGPNRFTYHDLLRRYAESCTESNLDS